MVNRNHAKKMDFLSKKPFAARRYAFGWNFARFASLSVRSIVPAWKSLSSLRIACRYCTL